MELIGVSEMCSSAVFVLASVKVPNLVISRCRNQNTWVS